ncbi:MAG: hypothetical protein QOK23_3605 [Gammaproteobacteria bacterium]|jgi:hypothetical protein|nr:hypothetical protein [Gammaproteobacteria bacterium]
MNILARGSLIFLIANSVACASYEAQLAKAQKRTDQAIAALMKMTDADSVAAAGLMSIGNHTDQSLRFLALATAAAPDRADLLWLQAMRCSELPPCDSAPIEQRLRELDPTNGAGWWAVMARAGVTHDSEGTDTALAAISHSQRVDIYWTTLIAHLSRAVANTKKMSLEESEVAVIGYLAAEAIPQYQYVSTSCKGERLQQQGVTETCRGVAKALQNGDTYVTEMIGVAIAKRVWPEESPEWKAAAEERRVYEYRSKLYSKLEPRTISHPGEYLTLCAQNRRESDLFAAQLIAAGYDPNPPAQ